MAGQEFAVADLAQAAVPGPVIARVAEIMLLRVPALHAWSIAESTSPATWSSIAFRTELPTSTRPPLSGIRPIPARIFLPSSEPGRDAGDPHRAVRREQRSEAVVVARR